MHESNRPLWVVGSRSTNRLALAGDDHRHAGCMHHGRTDRSQQHSREPSAATATNHDELSGLTSVEKVASRLIPNDQTTNSNVGIAFLPA